jgi:hypothetical protein
MIFYVYPTSNYVKLNKVYNKEVLIIQITIIRFIMKYIFVGYLFGV